MNDIIIKNIDVLEPYPNEIFYSWLSRMFVWYGYSKNTQTNIRNFNHDLFGKESKTVTNILIPYNIENLIKKINLPQSLYFKSVEVLINQTTIIPFYSAFILESDKKKLYKYLLDKKSVRISRALIGMNFIKTFSIKDYKFKFCYKCWKENNYICLDKEHQIIDNQICYKHNTILQYIESNSNEYFLFDDSNIEMYANAPFCIFQNIYLDYHIKISEMIHEINMNGFNDNIVILKSKLRLQMKNLGYMNNNLNYIENIEDFFKKFRPYNVLDIKSKELVFALFSTENTPNPVIYLTLIIFLFESLNAYYNYKIDKKDIKIICHNAFRTITKVKYKVKGRGEIYFDDVLNRNFGNEYKIIKKVYNYHYKIKHNFCGHIWISKQETMHLSNIILCPVCRKANRDALVKQARNNYVRNIASDFEYIDKSQSNWKLMHKLCGHTFTTNKKNIKKEMSCSKCKKNLFIDNKIKEFNEFYKNEYLIIDYIIYGKVKILHNDKNCLSEYYINLSDFNYREKCPCCKKIKSRQLVKKKEI